MKHLPVAIDESLTFPQAKNSLAKPNCRVSSDDILSAGDMYEALKAWMHKGCTASVCVIDGTDQGNPYPKLQHTL